jgi:chemotaxis protein CheC
MEILTLDLTKWTDLARSGSTTAMSGLSQMLHQDFKITALSVNEISEENVGDIAGNIGEKVVGIYLLFSGNANGQILLAFSPEIAFELVDMAMELPVGSTLSLGEMERSVLGEMGNIVGTFFLNGVADNAGIRLMPSPPVVVEDMAGALVDTILAEAFTQSNTLFIIKLLFCSAEKEVAGHFLVLPNFQIQN